MSFSLLLLVFVSITESTRGFVCYSQGLFQSCPSQEYGLHARLPILTPARDISWYIQQSSVLPKKAADKDVGEKDKQEHFA